MHAQDDLNMSLSMIFASRLPVTFWGDAVEFAAYILNLSPTSRKREARVVDRGTD